ncbi:hypothetical protein HYS42_00360 [Candidatus Saccharibacteria bacterium]|nr:hypothetical protein [Candidatus Saccharibacteria bacterium]
MKKNQRGIAHLVALIGVIVVLAVGFAGYKVMQSNKDKEDDSKTTTTTTTKTETWKDGDYAVKGTYADADVLKIEDNKWRMYYGVQPEVQGNQLEVYSATSTDGKTWTQESGTRKTFATFPAVVKLTDGKYRMYFQNASVIKSAISSDGLSFSDEAGTRIDTSNSENLTFDNVAAPTVLLNADGIYTMVYRGTMNGRYVSDTPNSTTQLLMWATSTDGLTFTKKGIAVDSRNSTLRGHLDGPNIVKWDDGSTRVYVTNYNGVYMYSFDGSKFTGQTLAFTLDTDGKAVYGIPPGDPTLAKINNVWYMYYGSTGTTSGIHYATLQ